MKPLCHWRDESWFWLILGVLVLCVLLLTSSCVTPERIVLIPADEWLVRLNAGQSFTATNTVYVVSQEMMRKMAERIHQPR